MAIQLSEVFRDALSRTYSANVVMHDNDLLRTRNVEELILTRVVEAVAQEVLSAILPPLQEALANFAKNLDQKNQPGKG